VDIYYSLSPSLARFISRHDSLRKVVRFCLLPVVRLSWITLTLGLFPALALMLLSLTLMVIPVLFVLKKYTENAIHPSSRS